QLEAADAGQLQVEQQAARIVVGCGDEIVACGGVGADSVAGGRQQAAERRAHRLVVVDEMNCGHHACAAVRAGFALAGVRVREGAGALGSVASRIVNAAPPPGRGSATMLPWWASTMERAIDSPSPSPPGLVVKKEANSASAAWAPKPAPRSLTRRT